MPYIENTALRERFKYLISEWRHCVKHTESFRLIPFSLELKAAASAKDQLITIGMVGLAFRMLTVRAMTKITRLAGNEIGHRQVRKKKLFQQGKYCRFCLEGMIN